MKNICHNFYRKIIFNASALTGENTKGNGHRHGSCRFFYISTENKKIPIPPRNQDFTVFYFFL